MTDLRTGAIRAMCEAFDPDHLSRIPHPDTQDMTEALDALLDYLANEPKPGLLWWYATYLIAALRGPDGKLIALSRKPMP